MPPVNDDDLSISSTHWITGRQGTQLITVDSASQHDAKEILASKHCQHSCCIKTLSSPLPSSSFLSLSNCLSSFPYHQSCLLPLLPQPSWLPLHLHMVITATRFQSRVHTRLFGITLFLVMVELRYAIDFEASLDTN